MGHSSFTFFLCPFHCPSEGPALEGQLRGADGIGRLKSGVAVPSAARLWSIFPVTLHVSACLLCHVVILYILCSFYTTCCWEQNPCCLAPLSGPQSALEPWVEEHIQGIL